MSIVADIVLLCDLSEPFTEDFEQLEHPQAIESLNAWLEEHEWAPLISFSNDIGSETAFSIRRRTCAKVGVESPVALDLPGHRWRFMHLHCR